MLNPKSPVNKNYLKKRRFSDSYFVLLWPMNALFVLFLNLGGGEVVMIVLVILLLFGGKGVPNLAKALGKGLREFKDAASGIQKDIQESTGGISQTIQEHIQEVKKEVDSVHNPEK